MASEMAFYKPNPVDFSKLLILTKIVDTCHKATKISIWIRNINNYLYLCKPHFSTYRTVSGLFK